jgi:hypothetical protein
VKRIVIETGAAYYQRILDGTGFWAVNRGDKPTIQIPDDIITSVEDVPDPPPTEPGERFWGKTKNTDPQWWFVRDGTDEVWYVPSGKRPTTLCASEIPVNGLVRLPEDVQ